MSNSKISTAANQYTEGLCILAEGLVSLGTLFGLYNRSPNKLGLFSSYLYGRNVTDNDEFIQFETLEGKTNTWAKVWVKESDGEGGDYDVLKTIIPQDDQIKMDATISQLDRENGATGTTYFKKYPNRGMNSEITIELQPHMWKFRQEFQNQLLCRVLFIQIPNTIHVVRKWWNNELSFKNFGKKVAYDSFLSLLVSACASLTNNIIPFIIDGFVSKKGIKCRIVLIVMRFGSEYFWTKLYNHLVDEKNCPFQLHYNDTENQNE